MSKLFGSTQEYNLIGYIWCFFSTLARSLVAISFASFRKLFKAPKSIRGQVALVTGAGQGLGLEIAYRLAAEGCHVAIVDINEKTACKAADELKGLGVKTQAYCTDVSKSEDVKVLKEKVLKDFGTVDIVVNNAGIVFAPPFMADTRESNEGVQKMMDVNVLSVLWVTKAFLPVMVSNKRGHIVSIASLAAYFPMPNNVVYTTTKYAIRGFMDALNAEIHVQKLEKCIGSSTIYPYFIDTQAEVSKYLSSTCRYTFLLDKKIVAKKVLEAILLDRKTVIIPTPFSALSYLSFPRDFWVSYLKKTFYCDKLPKWVEQTDVNKNH